MGAGRRLSGALLAAWAAKLERSGVFDGEAERDGKTPWSETKQRMPTAWACAVAGDKQDVEPWKRLRLGTGVAEAAFTK